MMRSIGWRAARPFLDCFDFLGVTERFFCVEMRDMGLVMSQVRKLLKGFAVKMVYRCGAGPVIRVARPFFCNF